MKDNKSKTAQVPLMARLRLMLEDRGGGAFVFAALALPVVLGFAGMGVDLTHWYAERRAMQNMADGAAVAGTHAAMTGANQTAILAAAQDGAIRNGWNVAEGYQLQVFSPPQHGLYPGLAGAVEAEVQRAVPLYFFGALGLDPVAVSARATGGAVNNGPQCVIALDHTADRAVNFTGTSVVRLGCGVAANSSSNQAIYVGGNATLEANPAQAFGDIYIGNNATLITQSPVQPYSQRVDDPYADIIMPVSPATCTYTNVVVQPSATVTLQPGRYCGGLEIKGTVDFAPGIYIIANADLVFTSQATVTGDEVTFVLTGATPSSVGNVRINGGATITLTPTTTGELAGILFYQDPIADPGGSTSIIESKFNGDAAVNLTGALYFPSRQVEYGGGSSAAGALCLHIVARRVEFSGNANITNDPAVCAAYGMRDVNQLRVQLIE